MTTKELVKTIRALEIHTKRKVDDIFSGNYKSSFRGQGLEISDLRKYEEGDDARHIDWTITAKQGKPYVRKFQETRELTSMILVDVSSSMNFTTSDKTKAQIALETAACLLFSAMKNNDKFGVIVFSDRIHSYIPPRKGRNHFLHTLREIIRAYEAPFSQATHTELALSFLNKTLKRGSIVFLLSDDISNLEESSGSGQRALKIANQKHDLVYINIFDQFERKINEELPALEIIDPESNQSLSVDLSDKKIINRYNELREQKTKKEEYIIKNSRIDSLFLSTNSNIYQELLLFFKKRILRY